MSEKNPAYVLPALRRYLIQLLTYLEQRLCLGFRVLNIFEYSVIEKLLVVNLITPHAAVLDIDFCFNVSSADNKCREESAKLLGCLIRNCEGLIRPYIAPIHKVDESSCLDH